MQTADPLVTFYRLIDSCRPPMRADRSAAGMLPARAIRYCDAVTQASGFGWYVFPPMDFSLLFDGEALFWSYEEAEDWMPLGSCQFPAQADSFDAAAPNRLRGCSPPFLSALPEPGHVQVWTGLFARTAADWTLLVRPPANLWIGGGYTQYEGIVETDRWFGPLFTNLRVTKTDVAIHVRAELPLLQVQPIHRSTLSGALLAKTKLVATMRDFDDRDWADYEQSVAGPTSNQARRLGEYAVAARKRREQDGCPYAPR